MMDYRKILLVVLGLGRVGRGWGVGGRRVIESMRKN